MSDLAALARRITVLEDIEAIRQLKHRYFFFCDRKRPADVLACFAPGEVRIDYGRIGQYSSAADMVRLAMPARAAPECAMPGMPLR